MSSLDKPVLKVAPCGYDAAKYAVENWHYSRCLPSFKRFTLGVWEDERFIGTVIFSLGAAPQAHRPYNIEKTEVCELTRVALKKHKTPVSRIVAIAIKELKRKSDRLRLIVSYADPEQDHVGTIYQAGGWIYSGPTDACEQFEYVKTGERVHTKTIRTGRRGYATELKRSGIIRSVKVWKHKYLMPLDSEMRSKIEPLRKPYPKRAGSSSAEHPTSGGEAGGSIPTPALNELKDQ